MAMVKIKQLNSYIKLHKAYDGLVYELMQIQEALEIDPSTEHIDGRIPDHIIRIWREQIAEITERLRILEDTVVDDVRNNKPWRQIGISRATWYRDQKRSRDNNERHD